MDWILFAHPERVIWMLAVLAMIIFIAWKLDSLRHKLGAFVSPAMQPKLVSKPTLIHRILQVGCLGACGVMSVFALMQPQMIQKEHISSENDAANIFIALDLSKSMLATDVAPDRLERAKSEIRDMLPSFSKHRVGLLGFAGRTTVMSPLTMDHGFFRLVLDNASPTSVTLGGTNLGEVIRKGTKLLSPHEGPKAMILISDGEDHDSYPLEAAEEARRAGVVIVTVGFGSESGTTIEVMDKETGRKKRITDASGKEVISKLDGELMREIALKTNGVYVPAETGVMDLEGIMAKHILPLVDKSAQVQVRETRIELFQWFIGVALVFFLGFLMLETGAFQKTRRNREKLA